MEGMEKMYPYCVDMLWLLLAYLTAVSTRGILSCFELCWLLFAAIIRYVI